MGSSTQPCLTPFVTPNDSENSPPTLTFAIIPVCRVSIIVVNFSGHPCFLSSCHGPVLPIVSNALLISTNNNGRSCSVHFSCSCRRQNIISMVLRLPSIAFLSHLSDFSACVRFCSSLQASLYAAVVDLVLLVCNTLSWTWSLLPVRVCSSWSNQSWCFLYVCLQHVTTERVENTLEKQQLVGKLKKTLCSQESCQ